MVANAGIRDTIATLNDLQQRLGLMQSQDADFFCEWTAELPALSAQEQAGIDRLKTGYDYHRADGLLLKGTINLVVTVPLLEIIGFIDPPFRLKSPYGVALELDDPIEAIRGFIDVLILQEHFWLQTDPLLRKHSQ